MAGPKDPSLDPAVKRFAVNRTLAQIAAAEGGDVERPRLVGTVLAVTARQRRQRIGRPGGDLVIRKLGRGRYRLYSRKKDSKTGRRRNLGTFRTREAAESHERAVQYFKRRG